VRCFKLATGVSALGVCAIWSFRAQVSRDDEVSCNSQRRVNAYAFGTADVWWDSTGASTGIVQGTRVDLKAREQGREVVLWCPIQNAESARRRRLKHSFHAPLHISAERKPASARLPALASTGLVSMPPQRRTLPGRRGVGGRRGPPPLCIRRLHLCKFWRGKSRGQQCFLRAASVPSLPRPLGMEARRRETVGRATLRPRTGGISRAALGAWIEEAPAESIRPQRRPPRLGQ
jgi:hypothetical protein